MSPCLGIRMKRVCYTSSWAQQAACLGCNDGEEMKPVQHADWGVKGNGPSCRIPRLFLLLWLCLSLALAFLLAVDPLFNAPTGLVSASLFTGQAGPNVKAEPCGWDYDGSWQIGQLHGASPIHVSVSNTSAISCASVGIRTASSYVAEPTLVLPSPGRGPPGMYAFYQLKSLTTSRGEIGVGVSLDLGRTWQHLGTVLVASTSLSSPWVVYDEANSIYVMIPDTHKARPDSIQLWFTTQADFPFGWQQLPKAPVTGERFMDTTAVRHLGQWWIFTTVKSPCYWGQDRSYSLRLYTAANLTGCWKEHPSSPITGDLRYARGGGRPFVWDGSLYRWAQDDSNWFGASLHLLKATALGNLTYMEAFVTTLHPSGNGSNWRSMRTHHIDMQQIGPNGTWFGLIDGDTRNGGMDTFFRHEGQFVLFKKNLLSAVLSQLLLVGTACFLLFSGRQLLAMMFLSNWYRTIIKRQPCPVRLWHAFCRGCLTFLPELQLLAMMVTAFVFSFVVFALLPQAFFCPRSAIQVTVIPTPQVTHVDVHAPYNMSGMVVVTGATASFFDRLTNMVGSMHVWEPDQKVIVYDLGFSQKQLAEMMCWQNVEVRRFPYEAYPPHVRDARNYAFKTLVLQEALKDHSAVLWIDSGLELRTNMNVMRDELAQHGHVSAMQEDHLGNDMYTYSRTMVDFFGMSDQWSKVKDWQFCAGGLQGFVRDSDAHRLILNPVANCSLHELECIAPLGSSRKNHNFDQTALTLMIWANNFSCLPRETHCMWSVKKVARNPLQLSQPIEVVSRGHRLPKPYTHYVRQQPGCTPDKSQVPWPAIGVEQESLKRYNLTFRIVHIYLQPIGDEVIQCLSCVGAHGVIQVFFWMQVGVAWMGIGCLALRKAWKMDLKLLAIHLVAGSALMLVVQLGAFHFATIVR